MASPITNCYDPEAVLPKLEAERCFLYRPETEWTYSHHPSLTWFNGRYLALWSNGRRDEDAPGQRVLMATSEDFREWTGPRPLVGPLQGKESELVLTAAGCHEHAGTLVAYAGQYEYHLAALEEGQRKKGLGDKAHRDTTLRALTTTDGEQWGEPLDLGIPIVPNHPPQRTASGRLIISGNVSFPYTDDPAGLAGWTMAGIFPDDMADNVADDSEGFWIVRERMGWPCGLCEGSFYQTDDRVLHMLLRSNTERLWLTESADEGATWSEPQQIEFSDNATKFHFGRLPDGRFYYVGCPDTTRMWERNPLVLSLSEDGVRFDNHHVLADETYEQKCQGMHKGGEYGYPHTLLHDGCLCVIVSRRKEAVEVLRVPIDSF